MHTRPLLRTPERNTPRRRTLRQGEGGARARPGLRSPRCLRMHPGLVRNVRHISAELPQRKARRAMPRREAWKPDRSPAFDVGRGRMQRTGKTCENLDSGSTSGTMRPTPAADALRRHSDRAVSGLRTLGHPARPEQASTRRAPLRRFAPGPPPIPQLRPRQGAVKGGTRSGRTGLLSGGAPCGLEVHPAAM